MCCCNLQCSTCCCSSSEVLDATILVGHTDLLLIILVCILLWGQADLEKVDRSKTPWLIAVLHAPWYNSNSAHQGEGNKMMAAMESTLYAAKVDIMFAGHVHAYERAVSKSSNAEKRNCKTQFLVFEWQRNELLVAVSFFFMGLTVVDMQAWKGLYFSSLWNWNGSMFCI